MAAMPAWISGRLMFVISASQTTPCTMINGEYRRDITALSSLKATIGAQMVGHVYASPEPSARAWGLMAESLLLRLLQTRQIAMWDDYGCRLCFVIIATTHHQKLLQHCCIARRIRQRLVLSMLLSTLLLIASWALVDTNVNHQTWR